MILCSLFIFCVNFHKKLISLLSLEMVMIIMIFSFFYALKECSMINFSFFTIILIMMVLDSVLGICVLINSCRSSSKSILQLF